MKGMIVIKSLAVGFRPDPLHGKLISLPRPAGFIGWGPGGECKEGEGRREGGRKERRDKHVAVSA